MNKPKAQTLQQKMGFFDEDLKKPKHDEIMLWLDSNIETIVNNLFNKPFTEKEIDLIKVRETEKIQSIIKVFETYIKNIEEELNLTDAERTERKFGLISSNSKTDLRQRLELIKSKKEILENFDISSPEIYNKPRITKIIKKWELPVSTTNYNNKYTIGFIDFSASFNIPKLEFIGLGYTQSHNSGKINYNDINVNDLKFGYIAKSTTIFVEVKSEITSLGELIRQINQYKSYLNGEYYVLCPENKYKELLKEQGINTIDYEL